MTMEWKIFTGDPATPGRPLGERPPTPPWRDFGTWRSRRGMRWRPSPKEVELINAAILLRRPLLVTGAPGTGKTSLAYAVANELRLGEVLVWPVNSRSIVVDGLYQYDAIGRLRDISLKRESGADAPPIETYLRLGPLGTALVGSTDAAPRVVLLDEIDKADVDFPNDLLHVLEDGAFEIPELRREAGAGARPIRTADRGDHTAQVCDGRVQASAFPFLVITSNNEREMPPAFYRRCIRLDIEAPSRDHLEAILASHLEEVSTAAGTPAGRVLDAFKARLDAGDQLAIDQLLNAVYLISRGQLSEADAPEAHRAALRRLDGE